MKVKHVDIIDPIHDFIRTYEPELKIIDTPIFQRLRRIRQLSGAHFTYPCAQHTRFEHSLGVMHITGLAAQTLMEKQIIDADDIKNLRLAALLHDIGHGPFSHLFEEVLQQKKKVSHEEIGRKILLHTEIGDILTKFSYDKKLLSELSFGKSKLQFMNEIISGPLSADLMDYLRRDGYFTGAEYAKIDHKRITKSLDVYKKRLALEKSALYSFESMVLSRYQMFKAVYFHKTVRSAEVMLLEAMSLADSELGLTSLDLNDYLRLTDEFVVSSLLSLPTKNSDLKRAKKFAEDYQNRRLLKCVFEKILTTPGSLSAIGNTEIRRDLSKKSKINEDEIFVDSSVTHSIPLTPQKTKSQSVVLVTRTPRLQATEMPISEIPLVSTIYGIMNILRIYTFEKNRNKVEMAAQSILGD